MGGRGTEQWEKGARMLPNFQSLTTCGESKGDVCNFSHRDKGDGAHRHFPVFLLLHQDLERSLKMDEKIIIIKEFSLLSSQSHWVNICLCFTARFSEYE